LLEVMIALVIMAIGLLGTILLETTTVTGNAYSRELQAATILAEDFLEQVKSMDYNNPDLSGLPADNPHQNAELNGIANPIDESGNNGGFYNRSWQVSDPGPIPNTKTVRVTVSWTIKGTNHSVALSTVKHLNAP
jgi:type II secretory pathway pseudopilin PulG